VALGFTAAAVWPLHRVEAWHLAFAGGYTLLTLGIGTRVVVSHGGHAMSEESVVLSWWAVAALAAATLLRALGPVFDPLRTTLHHAIAAGLAALALSGWFVAAWPRIRRTRPRLLRVEPPREASSDALVGVVLDDPRLGDEHHLLGHVRGQVGDALEVPAHEHERHRALHLLRVGDHAAHELREQLSVERVHLVVAPHQQARRLGVAANERVQRVAQHGDGLLGQLRQVRERLHRRLARELLGAAGDVHRMIAHALQVGGDLERRRDEPQVARQRLLQRQELDAALLDVDLHAVDRGVVAEHLLGQRGITARKGFQRLADDGLGAAAHEQEFLLQSAICSSKCRCMVRGPGKG
jgi:hypothetical protein